MMLSTTRREMYLNMQLVCVVDSFQLRQRFRETCPKGIDVFFDNVGGDILAEAFNRINLRKHFGD
jgi:NADPH-dependent curcumin reductase CurA